jgi:hypothetical protein
MFGRGRRKLTANQTPKLEREERVVAWAPTSDGDPLVVTNYGIFLPGGDTRLAWNEIHKAAWTGRSLIITPAELLRTDEAGYVVTADGAPVSVVLTDPAKVPEEVRVRVTKSVAYTTHRRLPDGNGARVVARRVPGANGVSWAVRYDDGGDGAAEQVRAVTAALVAHGVEEMR